MTDLHPRRLRHSEGLVRVASLIMVLISIDLASEYENFENFGAFCKFLVKLQVFPVSRPRRARGHFEGLLGILQTWHFWKGHAKRKITSTREKFNFEI